MEKKIKVGKNEYGVGTMEPDKAIEFCTDAAVALTPVLSSIELGGGAGSFLLKAIPNIGLIDAEKLKDLFAVVRNYMILPNGADAGNEFQFHEWFSKNPKDLVEAHVRVMWSILSDFFPQELGMIVEEMTSPKV